MASSAREGLGESRPWRQERNLTDSTIRPRSNSGKSEKEEGASVRKSIEMRRRERRAAVDSARSLFYNQDNKSASFVYNSGDGEDSRSRASSRTKTAQNFSTTSKPLQISLPAIPPRQPSIQYQQKRRTASDDIDAFPLPPLNITHTSFSPTSPQVGFSYNTTPMPPPTPPRPPGTRNTHVVTLKEKLNKALTRRRDKLEAAKAPPAFHQDQRPGSNGESLPLTYTSTHSRSQSGVSTPPTQHSNPSPTMQGEYPQFPMSKSAAESDWVSTNWGTQESLYYDEDEEDEDYSELPAIRPNSARAVRPMQTIEEEEAARLNRRTGFSNLHNPNRRTEMPASSSFESGMVLSSSMDLYGDSIDDRQALASFDLGLNPEHVDEDGNPDSFGSNYIPSDDEDYEDCSQIPTNSDVYNNVLSDDEDEPDVTRQVGMQSSYLTDESLAARAMDAEERKQLAKEFPTVQAYLRAMASSPVKGQSPADKSGMSFLEAKSPEDKSGMSYLDAKTPDERVGFSFLADKSPEDRRGTSYLDAKTPDQKDGMSFLEVITPSSETDIQGLNALVDNTNRTSGPHAITMGPPIPAAQASSTILGRPSLHATDSSSEPSRLSSFRTANTSSSGTRRGGSSVRSRPTVNRNSSSYMTVNIQNSEQEEAAHRTLEEQIRRLSKISGSSSSGDAMSGIAVVIAAHGDGPGSRASICGSIEIMSGGASKSITPRTPGSRMLSSDEGRSNNNNQRDDQSETSDNSCSGRNQVETSESDEEALLKSPRQLLAAQKVGEGVKVHPADARYDHVYRMRESVPDAQQVMVPVYNYSPTSAFPHRNALTVPQPAKIIDRFSRTSNDVFELGTIRSSQYSPAAGVGNMSTIRSPGQGMFNPQLKLGSPRAHERASRLFQNEFRQPLSRRDPELPTIDDATLKRMKTVPPPTVRSKSAMSGSSHVELPKSPTIQTLHPALRSDMHPARFSTPKLRLPKSSHRYDEEANEYLPLDPEVRLEQRRISRILFLLSCLFPPFLLVLAYGGFDAVVYELSEGRCPVADSKVKTTAKWVGWGLAVTIVAGVGGGVIGAVLVARG